MLLPCVDSSWNARSQVAGSCVCSGSIAVVASLSDMLAAVIGRLLLVEPSVLYVGEGSSEIEVGVGACGFGRG